MPLDPSQLDAKAEPLSQQRADAASSNVRARRADDPDVVARIDALVADLAGAGPSSTFHEKMVREMVQTALKLIPDGRDTGEIKLLSSAFKELRYAYRVFGRYKKPHKVTIFGSARTPKEHPDYAAAVDFSKLMAEAGWMSITGAGLGIMEAGHVGPGRGGSFGVAIRLPFETSFNPVIEGDEKLIEFRYFFTRKLMFVSQAEAVALFPGGFGTMDEAFETLTLVQTGKSTPMPIVLVEGKGHDYWENWLDWMKAQLLDRGWISPEDSSLIYLAKDAKDAAEHILRFYRVYHSSRYVRDELVIRMNYSIGSEAVARLEQRFATLIKSGGMRLSGPIEGEDDALDKPRLIFKHTRSKYGMVRQLIDAINECPPSA
jgi:uncharacterized protein (TIGR00730 family)